MRPRTVWHNLARMPWKKNEHCHPLKKGRDSHILTINSGSSSIKFSLYGLGETEALILKGELAGIGVKRGYFQAEDQAGHQLTAQNLDLLDHDAAWKTCMQ